MSMDAVVAVYSDWGIGSDGTQPVVIPEDRRHFAKLTKGSAVIMGRRTLCDCPNGKPLPGRDNIILSRSCPSVEGAAVVSCVDDAVSLAEEYERCFVLGGASVFDQLMPYVDRVFVTKIGIAPPSDSFFPNLDESPDWVCVDGGEPFISNGIECRFCVYERVGEG